MNTQMPQYELNGSVPAAKIQNIVESNDGSFIVTFTDQNIQQRTIRERDLKDQQPPNNARGWYLIDLDGHAAFLPGPLFEQHFRHAGTERKTAAA